MDTGKLKNFSRDARRELRKQVGLKLDYVLNTDSAELRQRAAQVSALKEALAKEGREGLIERVAYTWFNRFAALRFMDANGYHPFGVRVITPANSQETMPELLQHARAGVLDAELRTQLDTADTFDGVLSGSIPTASREGSAYRMLLVAACHYYHRLMPFLFEKLGDATELLLPDDLLTEHSVLAPFRTELADEDCQDVEVIGWLYQFYISEKKDQVMARKSAVPTEDIPAVTQLFTPHWIVRYLVENSLGRLWLLNRPSSKLKEKMPYYIEGEPETEFLKIGKPEEIKLMDPACGSGHMLTYAFDLLYAIYEEEGYDAAEISSLILRHNLYGLEICERAAALAGFALTMRARSRDNRFFRKLSKEGGDRPYPNVLELQEVRFEENELRDYIQAIGLRDLFNQPMLTLLHQFEEAKNFGSLIQPCLDERSIAFARRAIEFKDLGGQLFLMETHRKVMRVLEQAEALTQRYHVVVANPPYMGGRGMNEVLKTFVDDHYKTGKADLYGAFLIRLPQLGKQFSHLGMITIPNWMFLGSFEQLRKDTITNLHISSLIHNGRGLWGSDFGSCAFTLVNKRDKSIRGKFKRLFIEQGEVSSGEELQARFADDVGFPFYNACSEEFLAIPGCPIAYWTGERFRAAFQSGVALKRTGDTRQGMATSDNNRFLRQWAEVSLSRVGFGSGNQSEATQSGKKWFPYNKGGEYRKWYGNQQFVVNWEEGGREIIALARDLYGSPTRTVKSMSEYFKESVSWSKISIADIAIRYFPKGFLFDVAGCCIFFSDRERLEPTLGFLNTILAKEFLKIFSPTLNFEAGHLAALPIVPMKNEVERAVTHGVTQAVAIARADWDNFETSWDFRDQPLLRTGLKAATLEASWRNWESHCTAAIRRMQELETENNRFFIAAYGLEGELQPEVPVEQITLARADARRDIAAFISYAIGCMMGRYSLDVSGLVLADAGAGLVQYLERVPKPTFAPDEDGIVTVLEGEWFEDDIVGRTREFLRVTFGEETLQENLRFLEASLGKGLRKYFTSQFYKDHLQTYKKRPIYWMVSSPEGSFQALIYLHRYTRDTLHILLNDYVREFIGKLEAHLKAQQAISASDSARGSDRTKAAKEAAKTEKMLKELRTWERDVVLPLAQQRIELDLDDGVKVNYLKFPGLLVPIPGLEKKEEE